MNSQPGDDRPRSVPGADRPSLSNRTKAVTVVVVAVVLVLTLVLCCVGISQLGQLLGLDPRLA